MEIIRNEPWITEDANKILADIIRNGKELSVLEFGAGASTLWFLKQPTIKKLVTVENYPNWFVRISNEIPITTVDYEIILKPRPYYDVANRFIGDTFDIILVDGRDRVKCLITSLPKLKSGGYMILDNSEREYYQHAISYVKHWQTIETTQENPDKYGFTYPGWKTTFYKRP